MYSFFSNITPVNKQFTQQLQDKIDNLNKPKGSLGKLEDLALKIGLIQQSLEPELSQPAHILFGADHGIEREGVSLSPREITWQQMKNFAVGGGGVNMFCRQHHVPLHLIDVGVDYDFEPEFLDKVCGGMAAVDNPILNRKIDYGTRNFLHEYAMTQEQFQEALEVGASEVEKCAGSGTNIISFGEMGIANTSPSSVWMYFFESIPLDKCVGAGAGLDKQGIAHKYEVLKEAVRKFVSQVGIDSATPLEAPADCTFKGGRKERNYFPEYAKEIIRWFGGFEMAATIGAMLKAAEKKMVILVDGFIMTACALAAVQIDINVFDYMIFTHVGDESGHAMMLKALGADPVLHLGLKLGEGTGALCALPIIQSAVNMINEMDNFQHANITKYF